jgi:hypothetical protein
VVEAGLAVGFEDVVLLNPEAGDQIYDAIPVHVEVPV